MSRLKSLTLTLAALAVAAPAFALGPINQEKHINDTLRQGFIADKIADTCPTLAPRKLRALDELNKLKNYALKQGYTADEIRSFVTSKTEKKRGKAEAAAWLKKAGAVDGDAESYCRIGRDEIARGSLIGALLRDKS